MPYNNIEVISLPYQHVESAQDTRYFQFFSSEHSNTLDRLLINYSIDLTSKDNLMSNLFSSDFKSLYFCIVYDISSYDFYNYEDVNDFLDGNVIILDDTNFYRGYILPYSMTTYINSPDIDFTKWNVDSILERGDIVPYYEVDGIGTTTQIYRLESGNIMIYVDNNIVGSWNLHVRASAFDYFKGFIGSFGLTCEAVVFPRFEYHVDDFVDFLGVFEYVFDYLGRVGVFLQVIFSNMLYGCVPVFTIYGV
jgi:hypothetical protein